MNEPTNPQHRILELEEALAHEQQRCREMRAGDERFRKIFDHSNDAIFLVDPEADEIIDANERACKMLGYARDEIRSLPMSIIHPDEMPQLRAFAQCVYEDGQGFTDELSCVAKTGNLISAEISASITEIDGRACMISLVRDVSERDRLALQNEYLEGEFYEELRVGAIIGRSAALKKILQQIEMVANTNASVLVTGESGTGKELVATAIHQASDRANHPLVRVNCPSIPHELFESEFFGHIKGSFTGAVKDRVGRFKLADGGTIFLDEIGEIPIDLQAKLLRVLQEGQFERVGESRTQTVDVRVVAATNRDLEKAVAAGRFREDLFYRLSVFPIDVPPLRARTADIAPLAAHALEQACKRLKVRQPALSRTQIRRLEAYDWPGNVRELQNVIERAVILSKGNPLHFNLGKHEVTATQSPPSIDAEGLTLLDLKALERDIIMRALRQANWKVYGSDGAAAQLELPPTTLASRMKKLGITKSPQIS